METKKHFSVDFADVKDVLVISFNYRNPFSGCLEGSEHSNSMSKLERVLENAKEEGHYFKLTSDQIYKVRHPARWDLERARETDLLKPDEALRRYLFTMEVYYLSTDFYKSYLTIYWFGEAPSGDETLRDLVNERTKTISLLENALTYNIDD